MNNLEKYKRQIWGVLAVIAVLLIIVGIANAKPTLHVSAKTISPDATLKGTAADMSTVYFKNEKDSEDAGHVSVDDHGKFSIDTLVAGSTYKVFAQKNGKKSESIKVRVRNYSDDDTTTDSNDDEDDDSYEADSTDTESDNADNDDSSDQSSSSSDTESDSTNDSSSTESATHDEKAALKSAQYYSSSAHMSQQGVYDQLTSSADKFSPEAAQYAINNLNANWDENALQSAKSYQKMGDMSTEEIREQLTSSYGEQFTQEQADFAIAHLSN
ncbi:Ltp family lipoprotein [Furfurilactobacillus sp. WILCCON 0119]